MTDAEFQSKIKIGARVRIKRGAQVRSKNPRQPLRTCMRPYWVKVEGVDREGITWRGSANYPCFALTSAIDEIEDLI